MSFCPNKPLRIRKRLAQVVVNGTPGALSSVFDALFVTLPSPRVQCQLSIVPAAADLGDSSTFFQFVVNATTDRWSITPMCDLRGDEDVKNYNPVSFTINGSALQEVFGGNGQALAEVNAFSMGVGYLLSGETTKLWRVLFQCTSPNRLSTPPRGHILFVADFEPRPDAQMSREEWDYWRGQCAVQQLSNERTTPVLQCNP